MSKKSTNYQTKIKEMIGKKFGLFFVLARGNNDKSGKPKWICVCDCGTFKAVGGTSLRVGHSTNCGCVRIQKNMVHISTLTKTHGMRNTRTYSIWRGMLNRCNNPNATGYHLYGGRGIAVCELWSKFENFYADMGEAPRGLTIDRINSDENYEPGNCRWATMKEQENNRRNNVKITYCGETRSVGDWASILGVDRGPIYRRLARGWSVEDALDKPIKK